MPLPHPESPRQRLQAVIEALQQNERMGYTEAAGLLPLRERIVQQYAEAYGVTGLSKERVFVTTGSSGYPCYRNMLKMLGMVEVPIPVDVSTNFQPTIELIQRAVQEHGPLAGLVVASPSNPTGTMLTPDELQRLCAYCHQNGIRFISDEIYHNITYGTRPQATAIQYSDSAFVVNSFSKYHCMTGWRVGWTVVPSDLVEAFNKLQQNAFINAPTVGQVGALAALDCEEELNANVATYRENRRILLEGLPKAGLHDLASSDGAFYIYANVSQYTTDSLAFCKKILQETGVACTPGVDFDQQRGHLFCRFSFCQPTAKIQAAMEALRDWLPRQPLLQSAS